MIQIGSKKFREAWTVDFELSAPPGERPAPICLVAKEFGSGRTLRLWQDELERLEEAPYSADGESLFIAYYASAEMGCHLALGWPMPVNVLDLFAEFRNLTNGRTTPCGAGLLGALAYCGLPSVGAAGKESMQELAMRGGPWTSGEQAALLEYCESDVAALGKKLPKMAPKLDMPRAL